MNLRRTRCARAPRWPQRLRPWLLRWDPLRAWLLRAWALTWPLTGPGERCACAPSPGCRPGLPLLWLWPLWDAVGLAREGVPFLTGLPACLAMPLSFLALPDLCATLEGDLILLIILGPETLCLPVWRLGHICWAKLPATPCIRSHCCPASLLRPFGVLGVSTMPSAMGLLSPLEAVIGD